MNQDSDHYVFEEEVYDYLNCDHTHQNSHEHTCDSNARSTRRDRPPEFLLSAMLSGLYYLPPERILRWQTGFGRRVRYKGFEEIKPRWQDISFHSIHNAALDSGANDCDKLPCKSVERIECAVLPRYHHRKHEPLAQSMGFLRVYKVRFFEKCFKEYNSVLAPLSMQKSTSQGISVSNAGGYHSQPNLFTNHAESSGNFYGDRKRYKDASDARISETLMSFGEVIDNTLKVIECHDAMESRKLQKMEVNTQQPIGNSQSSYASSSSSSTSSSTSTSSTSSTLECTSDILINEHQNELQIRELERYTEAEAWLNVSQHGCWNRLHTHEGAVWSGVYYVSTPNKMNNEFAERSYQQQHTSSRSSSSSSSPSSSSSSPLSQSNVPTSQQQYVSGGELLLKPTPHPLEMDSYSLTAVEQNRLNSIPLHEYGGDGDGDGDDHNDSEKCDTEVHKGTTQSIETSSSAVTVCKTDTLPNEESDYGKPSFNKCRAVCMCDYITLDPEEGTMIIFPSYLHHAVLPLFVSAKSSRTVVEQKHHDCEESYFDDHCQAESPDTYKVDASDSAAPARISLAFNVNAKRIS